MNYPKSLGYDIALMIFSWNIHLFQKLGKRKLQTRREPSEGGVRTPQKVIIGQPLLRRRQRGPPALNDNLGYINIIQ